VEGDGKGGGKFFLFFWVRGVDRLSASLVGEADLHGRGLAAQPGIKERRVEGSGWAVSGRWSVFLCCMGAIVCVCQLVGDNAEAYLH
jgi:hypothetical protein